MRERVARNGRQVHLVGAVCVALAFGAGAPDSPVADAAMRGDTEAVRALLREGADVNAAQGDGMTALHWAARHGDVTQAQILIYAGANVGAVTRLGDYTPLHLASKAGHGDVIVTLLEAGSEASAPTSTGAVQPIHFAAASGSADAVAALLDHGADANARESEWGQTPLMFAAAANRVAAVNVLLERAADPTVTARVIDIAAREELDRADQARRRQLMAALRAAAEGAAQEERGRPGQQAGQQRQGERGPDPDAPPEQRLRGGTEIDPLSYADLVGSHGGLTALLLAVREGHVESVDALLEAGVDINQVSASDKTSPLLMAAINGHFDLALSLLERGADPRTASDAGATPLYTTLNTEWIPKSRHPQPTESRQQRVTYLELMEALLDAGADVNARLTKPLWYTTYNNDLLRVDRTGATPFWRAAFATNVAAMRLLMSYGADPTIATKKVPQRSFGRRRGPQEDLSGLPELPVGGPAVYPIHAASGVGYGQGFAANSHRHVPDGWLPAVQYLVEELGADVNARDLNGYSPVHHAAARGDNELIRYLVSQGADVTLVSRRGQTTVDMANGPVQRIQPFPETIALLESLGAVNNHNCVSC
jgi:ankyrin repeat protein